jgi:group I intron endonuclease
MYHCDIYGWFNLISGKCYIGQSIEIEDRKKRELWELNVKKVFNYCPTHPFLRAWQKYGEENFEFKMIASCDTNEEDATFLEDCYIQYYRSLGLVYNICNAGTSRAGIPQSPEVVLKRSISMKATLNSPEYVHPRLGSKSSIETCNKISKAKLGVPLSEKHKLALSRARLGKSLPPLKEEHKQKIRDKRALQVYSEEAKTKMSKSAKARFKNEEPWNKNKAGTYNTKSHKDATCFEAFGENKTLLEWSKDVRCVVKRNTLASRLYLYNWDVERAITTPIQ